MAVLDGGMTPAAAFHPAKGPADPRGIEQDHGPDRYEQSRKQTETQLTGRYRSS